MPLKSRNRARSTSVPPQDGPSWPSSPPFFDLPTLNETDSTVPEMGSGVQAVAWFSWEGFSKWLAPAVCKTNFTNGMPPPHRSPTDSPDFIELSDIFSIFSMKQYEAVMKWPRNWGPRRLQVLPSPPVLNTPDPWMDSFVHRPGPFAAELRTTLAAATPSPVLQMLGLASEGVRVFMFSGDGQLGTWACDTCIF